MTMNKSQVQMLHITGLHLLNALVTHEKALYEIIYIYEISSWVSQYIFPQIHLSKQSYSMDNFYIHNYSFIQSFRTKYQKKEKKNYCILIPQILYAKFFEIF